MEEVLSDQVKLLQEENDHLREVIKKLEEIAGIRVGAIRDMR